MDLQYILAPVIQLSKGRTPSPPPKPPPLHLLPPPTYPLPCPGVATPPGLEPPRPPRPFVPHPDDVILSFDTTVSCAVVFIIYLFYINALLRPLFTPTV